MPSSWEIYSALSFKKTSSCGPFGSYWLYWIGVLILGNCLFARLIFLLQIAVTACKILSFELGPLGHEVWYLKHMSFLLKSIWATWIITQKVYFIHWLRRICIVYLLMDSFSYESGPFGNISGMMWIFNQFPSILYLYGKFHFTNGIYNFKVIRIFLNALVR